MRKTAPHCVVAIVVVCCPMLITLGQGGGGEPPPICGQLNEGLCCSSIDPGGCTCAPAGHGCQCSNTGTLKLCYIGSWTYTADPNGDSLVFDAPEDCYTTYACLSAPAGGQSCGGIQGCTPPCQWFSNPTIKRNPYKINANCTNGQVD